MSNSAAFSLWLLSYLDGRQQRVRIGETVSSFSNVTSGVPQGSILGPILFAIFMSSYCPNDSLTSVIKYADDVTIIIPVKKNKFDDLTAVTCEIENFKKWCSDNKMTINTDKTKVLSINVTNNSLPHVPNLNTVTSLKLLGLFFNEKMNWSDHFDFIIRKLSKRLYVLRILKRLLSHDQLVTVFNAIFRSVIDYSSQVFLNPGKSLDVKLIRVCRRAFYIVHGENSCNLCNMLDVTKRRQELAMRLFNEARMDCHHVLHDIVPETSARSNRIILPYVRTTRRLNAFFFSCSVSHNDQHASDV